MYAVYNLFFIVRWLDKKDSCDIDMFDAQTVFCPYRYIKNYFSIQILFRFIWKIDDFHRINFDNKRVVCYFFASAKSVFYIKSWTKGECYRLFVEFIVNNITNSSLRFFYNLYMSFALSWKFRESELELFVPASSKKKYEKQKIHQSILSTLKNASCGSCTFPIDFILFLPAFCFSKSFLFLVISPP